jgi:predicted phage replisome organizer
MAQKYYYMRLRDNFFDRDEIKVIESQENGYIYSNILLKIYLRSLKHDGILQVADLVPYDPKTLAKVIGHDIDHVVKAINIAVSLKLIEKQDDNTIFIHDLQNFIGRSTDEADRIRLFREKSNENKALIESRTNVRQKSDILEIEREIKIEREINKEAPNGDYQSLEDIFNTWNETKVYVHRSIDDKLKRKMKTALKEYSLEAILSAIKNYSAVMKDNKKYYWSHKWALIDFLSRGLSKFVNEGDPLHNFLRDKNGSGGFKSKDEQHMEKVNSILNKYKGQ